MHAQILFRYPLVRCECINNWIYYKKNISFRKLIEFYQKIYHSLSKYKYLKLENI